MIDITERFLKDIAGKIGPELVEEVRLFPANPTNLDPKCNFITEPDAGPFRPNTVIGFQISDLP